MVYWIATLIRAQSTTDFEKDNTFVGPRGIFITLELARNREGHLPPAWNYEDVPDESTPLQRRADMLLREAAPQAGYADDGKRCKSCKRTKPAKGKRLLRCSRCKKATYCSADCQKLDWSNHKDSCLPASS